MKIFKLKHISAKTETTENMLRTGSEQKIPLIFRCQNDTPKCTKFQKALYRQEIQCKCHKGSP